jgi:hypothetical protein
LVKNMNFPDVDETKLWNTAYSTPMIEATYKWATSIISGGHTGGVLYAPTRTGKTKTIELLTEELKAFKGPRGNIILSETVWVITADRLVMSEGGFWDWLLKQFNHQSAGTRHSPLAGRHLVYEHVKGLARKCPAGRLVMFVDEAQILELTELGWFADLFNALQKDGYELIIILVGSYHLHDWIGELAGKKHEHVRSRFFAKEHRLTGLTTILDFERCLRRFDADKSHFDDKCSITEFYLQEWFGGGGRLGNLADIFREAFRSVGGQAELEVPMAHFIRAVRQVLNEAGQDCDVEYYKKVVRDTGFLHSLAAPP